MTKRYEIRCPIHGFIKLDKWEWDVIHHPAFQRLRRIRQLAWTDMVYPAAMHTRFEHSLGVMHTATRMFDEVWYRQAKVLQELHFSNEAKARHRIILRLAALLHDVGHSPFSHAGEEIMPLNADTGKRYKHEDYSWSIIRNLMIDVIDDHSLNKNNFNIKASEVADFLEGKTTIGHGLLFWRQLVDSQLDADRADYLLRDSYHVGVEYGRYDLNRLIVSFVVGIDDTDNPVLAISEGGWHTAVALILARYMMFSQVYFHKVRRIYDFHLTKALRVLLGQTQGGGEPDDGWRFPPPTTNGNLESYLAWTDWRVLGLLEEGGGGDHGEIIRRRDHYRVIYETQEFATEDDENLVTRLRTALQGIDSHIDSAKTSPYKKHASDEISVALGHEEDFKKKTVPLSAKSRIVRELQKAPTTQVRLYVPHADRDRALNIKDDFLNNIQQNGERLDS